LTTQFFKQFFAVDLFCCQPGFGISFMISVKELWLLSSSDWEFMNNEWDVKYHEREYPIRE